LRCRVAPSGDRRVALVAPLLPAFLQPEEPPRRPAFRPPRALPGFLSQRQRSCDGCACGGAGPLPPALVPGQARTPRPDYGNGSGKKATQKFTHSPRGNSGHCSAPRSSPPRP
jgi:hypothetical protein